jgi:hypothetical protein
VEERIEQRMREIKEKKDKATENMATEMTALSNDIKTKTQTLVEQLLALREKITDVGLKNEIGIDILYTVCSLHPDVAVGPLIEEVD